jgi:diaminopimelate epimerase
MFFWKMSGAGNDFIVVNNMREKIPVERFPAIAQKLCERRLSIGADGIVVVERAGGAAADVRALIFNADGSEAEMCGNGVRCVARYAYEEGLAGSRVGIETGAGHVEVSRLSKREYRVKLQAASVFRTGGRAAARGREYSYTYVELGSPGIPHIVVPIEDLRNADRDALRLVGRALRRHDDFPRGTNVNFYDIIDNETVELLTYERGVEDFTYACGTGSGSTALALRLQNIISADTVKLCVPGGLLKVELMKKNGGVTADDGTAAANSAGAYDIRLIGDTNIIFKGDVLDEDFAYRGNAALM